MTGSAACLGFVIGHFKHRSALVESVFCSGFIAFGFAGCAGVVLVGLLLVALGMKRSACADSKSARTRDSRPPGTGSVGWRP